MNYFVWYWPFVISGPTVWGLRIYSLPSRTLCSCFRVTWAGRCLVWPGCVLHVVLCLDRALCLGFLGSWILLAITMRICLLSVVIFILTLTGLCGEWVLEHLDFAVIRYSFSELFSLEHHLPPDTCVRRTAFASAEISSQGITAELLYYWSQYKRFMFSFHTFRHS